MTVYMFYVTQHVNAILNLPFKTIAILNMFSYMFLF